MTAPTLESLMTLVRANHGSEPPLDRLTRAIDVSNHLGELGENLIGVFVDEARKAGVSWADIGTRLGVSRQAVQKRFIPKSDSGFWDRATPALKETVKLARTAARARRKTYLGTEHLLLGLTDQPDDPASAAFSTCGAPPATLRAAVDGRVGAPAGEPLPDETPFTRLALQSLQHAQRESLLLEQTTVDNAHLALALIAVGEGAAHDVLLNLGVTYEKLREALAS